MTDPDTEVDRTLAVRTPSVEWREAAGTLWVHCVENMDDDDAARLGQALVESARTDPEALFSLARDLGARVMDVYPEASAVLRRAALDILIDDPDRSGELACLLVVDLAESFDHDDIQPVIDRIVERYPGRELELRVGFMEALRRAWRCEHITAAQATAAVALAPDDASRLGLLVKVAELWGDCASSNEREQMVLQHAAAIRQLVALVEGAPPSAAVVLALLEIATPPQVPRSERGLPTSPETLGYVARADAMARSLDVSLDLLHRAAHAHAEHLLRAGELLRAEAVIAGLPGLDDDHLSTVALLEDLRRRLGLASEPQARAFVADDAPSWPPSFDTGFVEYFTYTRDSLAMIREHLGSADKVREWSHGAVTSAADLDSQRIFGPIRDYACECTRYLGARYRGVVCERCAVEVIQSSTRAFRAGHLSLARPVIHPWYLRSLGTLLETPWTLLRMTDTAELLERLRNLDAFSALEAARDSHRRREQQKIPLLDAFRSSLVKPKDLLLEVVPVWPPAATLPDGVDRGRLRAAYISLLEGPDPRAGVDALFSCFSRRG